MLKLYSEDVVTPTAGTRVTDGGYRFTISKEAERVPYLELAMGRNRVATDLGIPETPNFSFWVSFLNPETAVKNGLEDWTYVILAIARENGGPSKKTRKKGNQSVAIRVGSYDWSDETVAQLKQGVVNKIIEPEIIEMDDRKALLFKMPVRVEV